MSASADHREDGEPDLNALAAWAEGRLAPADRARLAAHVAACRQCRAIVAELTRGAAPAARSWRPALPIAATIAAVAIGAGAYLLVHQREQPAAATPSAAGPARPSLTPSPPAVSPPSASTSVLPRPSTPPDRKRAAGRTTLHGKSFHLVAGEWIDDTYRESDFLPVVHVSSREQLDSVPGLRPYATLGSRFTVVIRATVYRISIP